jgi:PAS domain S-box-containing protein
MKDLSKQELDSIFLNMVNVIDEGIIIVDAVQKNMPIIFANEGFYQITGYKPDEVIGKNPRFLIGGYTNKKVFQIIRNCIKKKQNGSFTLTNYKKDGTKFWNHFTITPIFDNENNVTHWVGIERDITLILDTTKSESGTKSMITTIHTISDLINNFLNYLSYFRNYCKDDPNFNKELLSELDDVYNLFIKNIRLLYSIIKYKDKKLNEDFSVLDFE